MARRLVFDPQSGELVEVEHEVAPRHAARVSTVYREQAPAAPAVADESATIRHLRHRLGHEDAAVRSAALDELARTAPFPVELHGALFALLLDPEARVRAQAAQLFRRTELQTPLVQMATKGLREPSVAARLLLLEGLTQLGSLAAPLAPEVFPLLLEPHPPLRQAAQRLLHAVGCPRTLQPIFQQGLKQARTPDRIFLLNAAKACGPAASALAPEIFLNTLEDDVRVASAAREALHAVGYHETLQPLLQRLLREQIRGTRLHVLRVLAQVGPVMAPATAAVVSVMGSDDVELAHEALRAFRACGFHPNCLPEIDRLLRHRNWNMRLRVIEALGGCGPVAAAAAGRVAACLDDRDEEVSLAAKKALAAIGFHPSCTSEIERMLQHARSWQRRQMLEAVANFGAEAAPVLHAVVARLADGEPEVRRAAADALVALGSPVAAETALRRIARDERWEIRLGLFEALARVGESARPLSYLALEHFRDSEVEVREAARQAFVRLGYDPACGTVLRELLGSPVWSERLYALLALGECGASAREVAPLVADFLRDPDLEVREAAVAALAALGYHESLAASFRETLASDDPGAIVTVLELCAHFGKRAAPLAAPVARCLQDTRSPIRKAAMQALRKLPLDAGAAQAVGATLEMDAGPRRERLLTVLREMGSQANAAAGVIMERFDDRDARVQRAAVEAFVAVGFHEQALTPFSRLIRHTEELFRIVAVQAMGACGQAAGAATPLLLGLLNDASRPLRETAAKALLSIGYHECARLDWQSLLGDRDPEVRRMGMALLTRLAERDAAADKLLRTTRAAVS